MYKRQVQLVMGADGDPPPCADRPRCAVQLVMGADGDPPPCADRPRCAVQLVMGADGDLSIDDFIVASMNQYRHLSDAVIKTMFAALDTDGDGWITADDAFQALQPTGVHLTVKELTKLFDKYGVKRRLGETSSESGARRSTAADLLLIRQRRRSTTLPAVVT